MLTVIEEHDLDAPLQLRIVMSPNRSLSWAQNKIIIAVFAVSCGGIAIMLAFFAGAWPVIPFAGLEITALAIALYYLSWKLNYRHILTLSDQHITIEKGVYRPRRKYRWNKHDSYLQITPARHDWEASKLCLRNPPEELSIGSFLGKTDTEQLVALLRQHIAVRQDENV